MNKHILNIVICLIIFLTGCSAAKKTNQTESVKQPTLDLSQQTPIVFLHGSGGSENDLTTFARDITDSLTNTSQLMITVDSANRLTYLNQLTDKEQHPLIFIGFEDSDAPIEEWRDGLVALFQDLKQHYQFETTYLVGFSNGGLAAAYFAESQSDYHDLPQLTKLVMIGAPFNDLEPLNNSNPLDFKDLSNQTSYFDKFLKKKAQLSVTLNVLAIAGDIGDPSFSDGVVPISSALGSRLIFPEYVYAYEEQISHGQSANHVGLISGNQEVIGWVSRFLFDSAPQSPHMKLMTQLKKR